LSGPLSAALYDRQKNNLFDCKDSEKCCNRTVALK
jgi:hypothetical protein